MLQLFTGPIQAVLRRIDGGFAVNSFGGCVSDSMYSHIAASPIPGKERDFQILSGW